MSGKRSTKVSYSTWVGVKPAEHGYDEVHTPEHPYCDQLSCWCHKDEGYHDQATTEMDDGLFEYAMALLGAK